MGHRMRSPLATAIALCAWLAAGGAAAPSSAPGATLPAGRYTLDKYHASLVFRVDHLGFSRYTARFTRFDAVLEIDPARPETATLTTTVDARSLTLDNAPDGFVDDLRGPQWLDTARFPLMTYRSAHVAHADDGTLRLDGELTLHGVTQPVSLMATFNGGYAGHPMDPNARIGFSARGSFRRSAFGISNGIPPAGSTMGVGDEVTVEIEVEFTGPAWHADPGQH